MDEQRTVRKVLELTQQSITEFLRYLKKAVEASIFRQQFQVAADMERAMLKVQENPTNYKIVTVTNGSEQDFEEILNRLDIPGIYINSDFLSDYNGSWILTNEDMEKFETMKELFMDEFDLNILDHSKVIDRDEDHEKEKQEDETLDKTDEQQEEESADSEQEPDSDKTEDEFAEDTLGDDEEKEDSVSEKEKPVSKLEHESESNNAAYEIPDKDSDADHNYTVSSSEYSYQKENDYENAQSFDTGEQPASQGAIPPSYEEASSYEGLDQNQVYQTGPETESFEPIRETRVSNEEANFSDQNEQENIEEKQSYTQEGYSHAETSAYQQESVAYESGGIQSESQEEYVIHQHVTGEIPTYRVEEAYLETDVSGKEPPSQERSLYSAEPVAENGSSSNSYLTEAAGEYKGKEDHSSVSTVPDHYTLSPSEPVQVSEGGSSQNYLQSQQDISSDLYKSDSSYEFQEAHMEPASKETVYGRPAERFDSSFQGKLQEEYHTPPVEYPDYYQEREEQREDSSKEALHHSQGTNEPHTYKRESSSLTEEYIQRDERSFGNEISDDFRAEAAVPVQENLDSNRNRTYDPEQYNQEQPIQKSYKKEHFAQATETPRHNDPIYKEETANENQHTFSADLIDHVSKQEQPVSSPGRDFHQKEVNDTQPEQSVFREFEEKPRQTEKVGGFEADSEKSYRPDFVSRNTEEYKVGDTSAFQKRPKSDPLHNEEYKASFEKESFSELNRQETDPQRWQPQAYPETGQYEAAPQLQNQNVENRRTIDPAPKGVESEVLGSQNHDTETFRPNNVNGRVEEQAALYYEAEPERESTLFHKKESDPIIEPTKKDSVFEKAEVPQQNTQQKTDIASGRTGAFNEKNMDVHHHEESMSFSIDTKEVISHTQKETEYQHGTESGFQSRDIGSKIPKKLDQNAFESGPRSAEIGSGKQQDPVSDVSIRGTLNPSVGEQIDRQQSMDRYDSALDKSRIDSSRERIIADSESRSRNLSGSPDRELDKTGKKPFDRIGQAPEKRPNFSSEERKDSVTGLFGNGEKPGSDGREKADIILGGVSSKERKGPLIPEGAVNGGIAPKRSLTIDSNQFVRTIHSGRHDAITRTIVHAAFDPAIEESDLHKGTKLFRNRAFVDSINAATVFAAKDAMQKDIRLIQKELSTDQQALLAKMIEGGKYGKFNLDNPEDLKESLLSLHEFMKDNGILESRSVAGKSQLYHNRARKKEYQGNIIDRAIDKRKKREIDLDDLKLNPVKGPKAKTKQTRWTYKERTVWKVRTIAKRNGAVDFKDADAIVDFLYKRSRRFANTNQAMKAAKEGLKGVLSVNPFKNSIISDRLQEDQYAKNIYKVRNVISGAKATYHGMEQLAELIGTRREAELAKRLNKLDKKLGQEGLDPNMRSQLDRTRHELDRKKQGVHNKNELRRKRGQERFEKKQASQLRKTNLKKKVTGKIKKAGGKLKKFVPKPIRTTSRFLGKVAYRVTRGVFKVIDIPAMFIRAIMRLVVRYILIPLLPFIGGYFMLAAIVIIGGGVAVTATMLINSFFTTEISSIDDATATNSSMRIVYNELQLEESQWSRNLRTLADGNVVHVNELLYANIDESTGNIQGGQGEMTAEEYLPAMLGLQYDTATDTIVTPSPWVGAPPEACRTADGTITGGVELRFIGTGGYPSYTSNIMELIAMTSTAQQNSSLSEFTPEDLADAAGEMFAGNAEGFFGSVWKKLVTSAVKIGTVVDRIASLIPGYSEFMTSQYAGVIAKTIMAYAKPLFDVSHQMAFGLQFSFLPTDRTLTMDGAESLNQFIQNSWYGEGGGNYQSLDEVRDSEVGREVWAYLLDHGFDEIHAAGVMGNFYQESRMNPNAVQYPGLRKGGIGLGQWTGLTPDNNRRLKLEQYAARITGSTEGWRNNVKLQLDYMMIADEPATVQRYLNHSFSDPGAAAYWWGANWERFTLADGSMESTRIPAANSYYELYAEDNSFDFSSGDGSGGTTGGSDGSNPENEETSANIKYVHSDNIDADGNVEGPYSSRQKKTETVKIPGATSLNIEIWYSTEEDLDWIRIRNKEQGSADWDSSDQVGIKLTGGESMERPEDGSAQHQTFTLSGDTAYFDFYTDRSEGYYGYYAKVTGKIVDQSWLEDQIEASSGYSNIIHDVHVCEGNNGHGCQVFSDFKYNDTTQEYVYYNDERIDNVYPAALDHDLSGEIACNVPSGSLEEFYKALDANPDCWEIVLEDSDYNVDGRGRTDGGSSSVIEGLQSDCEGFRASRISPSQFFVTVIADREEDYDEENDSYDWYHDEYDYMITHKCTGGHSGYYCGGHIRLVTYGIVYHMTSDQRAGNHESYTDYSGQEYYKDYSAGFFTNPEELVDMDRLRNATDLFGLDTAIRHVKNSVSTDFEGWTYDNIDASILPLQMDWTELYGISTSWTINGINGGSGGVDATIMSTSETERILETIKDQLPHDNTDKVRSDAIEEALFYVGKISYSQQSHGAVLKEGGKNDCSGFVSRIYYDVIGKILNTDGFVDWAKRYGAYRQFSDGNCKPGDILLSGMGNASRSDNHALLYVGTVDGTTKTVDCSNRGGNGNVYYSDRGSTYYSKCTYIDMTTAIKGYLTLYPDEAGNLLSEITEDTEK